MAKPKRAHQRPASAGTSRPAASGASARPASVTTANEHGNGTTATTRGTGKAAAAPGGAQSNGTKTAGRNGGGTSSGRMTSSAARAIASRAASPTKSRRRQQPSGWQRAIGGQRGVWIALVGIAVVVTLFVIIANMNGGNSTRQPVSATLNSQVTNVSPTVLAKVGTGGIDVPFKATPSGTKLLTSGGKPDLLYVGAEYCPHCAAQRWSMVVALSRFGNFSNLHLIKSTANDTPASVPTFTFYKSTYTSPYLTFSPVEIQDVSGNNLETLSPEQSQIFKTYDAPPYVASSSEAGAIPFLSLGNQYIQVGEGFPSTLIASDTWQSIGSDLSNPSSPEAQNILGNANYLTAAICQMTKNQPASVCTAAPIPDIQQKLPKGQ